MNNKLAGYTHEGMAVENVDDTMVTLGLVPFCFSWGGFRPTFSLALEFNKTPTGKRRPYVAMNIFGFLIQSGWLF
jgi:hypothetical protein